MGEPQWTLAEGYGPRQEQAIRLLALLGSPLLGGVIVLRRPLNPYGWLWSGYALAEAVYRFTSAHVTYASANGTAELWPARLSAWVNDFAFVPVIGLLVVRHGPVLWLRGQSCLSSSLTRNTRSRLLSCGFVPGGVREVQPFDSGQAGELGRRS